MRRKNHQRLISFWPGHQRGGNDAYDAANIYCRRIGVGRLFTMQAMMLLAMGWRDDYLLPCYRRREFSHWPRLMTRAMLYRRGRGMNRAFTASNGSRSSWDIRLGLARPGRSVSARTT